MNNALTGQDFLVPLDGYTRKQRRRDSWIENIYIFVDMYFCIEQISAVDGQKKFGHVSVKWSFLRQLAEREIQPLAKSKVHFFSAKL